MSNNHDTHEGKIKFFNEAKGFGFVIDKADSKEIFFHKTGLAKGVTVKEDDEVSFFLEEGKKGLMAVDIELS